MGRSDSIDDDGKRRRYFHERQAVEQRSGGALKPEVTASARRRIVRELEARAYYKDNTLRRLSLMDRIEADVARVLGDSNRWRVDSRTVALSHFLTALEVAAETLTRFKQPHEWVDDINVLQSILADDLSAYRFRLVDREIHLQRIDNAHLQAEIVDRTFELTTQAAFASAQKNYAEAWGAYSRARFDEALIDAAKAVESACKLVISKVDPDADVAEAKLNQLVPLLTSLDIFPSKLQTVVAQLAVIFQNSGALRNAAGVAHGSLDLQGPEAAVTLLGLRMSGTLVAFLAERWLQIKAAPKRAAPAPAADPAPADPA